jgi:hypothetical protein
MTFMTIKTYACAMILLAAAAFGLRPAPVLAQSGAQSAARVEFTARVSPSGGQPEPVRQMRFYLLRKSVEDIRAEALQADPGAGLDQFIDALSVTPELKAWMTKHHTVRLSGDDFTKGLTPEDVVDIPEFFKAYMSHNEAYRGVGFPQPKYKEKDREQNPEKYKDQKEEYKAAVRKFIGNAPATKQGMDLELIDLNPDPKWQSQQNKLRKTIDARAFQLAQERYVVARSETDLEGHGAFSGVAPGNYWIGMLGEEAISGDVRVHWDFPVKVHAGENASVELSNFNAARNNTTAQNSNN